MTKEVKNIFRMVQTIGKVLSGLTDAVEFDVKPWLIDIPIGEAQSNQNKSEGSWIWSNLEWSMYISFKFDKYFLLLFNKLNHKKNYQKDLMLREGLI